MKHPAKREPGAVARAMKGSRSSAREYGRLFGNPPVREISTELPCKQANMILTATPFPEILWALDEKLGIGTSGRKRREFGRSGGTRARNPRRDGQTFDRSSAVLSPDRIS
jgi:hypothetical protein